MIYFFYNFYKVVKNYYTKVLKKVLLCCILNLLEMPKFRRRLPTQSAFAEIIDGRLAMKAKIIHLIFTVLVGIATIVSAVFAVLSYYKM